MVRKHMDLAKKCEILALNGGYMRKAQIARELDIPYTTVSRVVKNWETMKKIERKKGSGRKKSLSKSDQVRIALYVKRYPKSTLSQVKRALDLKVAHNTIRKVLINKGFQARLTVKKPLLTEAHKTARVQWCLKYKDKTPEYWERVVFSDESPFHVIFQQREQTWIRSNDPPLITETKKFPTKINVWGGFCATGVTDLVKIEGNMDKFQFKYILENFCTKFMRQKFRMKRNKGKLQMDNDPKHKSKLVKSYLKQEHMFVFDWPSQSPDLNPIENIWSELDRKTKRDGINSGEELFEALSSEWKKLSPEYLKKLARSMPKRINLVIKNKGNPIKY